MQGSNISGLESSPGWDLILQFGLPRALSEIYGEQLNPSSSPPISTEELRHSFSIDRPPESQIELLIAQLEIFEGMAKPLQKVLESDFRDLTHEQEDESLLKKFVKSWGRYFEVINWLKQASPQFSETPTIEYRMSLEYFSLRLYEVIVVNKIQGAVVQAIFRLIQLEKDGTQIDTVLVKAVSAVFYQALKKRGNSYAKRWHDPIMRHFSRVYFGITGKWFEDSGLPRLDHAITQACQRVVNFFPNQKIARQARKTLKGVVQAQTYSRLDEMMDNNHPEIASLLIWTEDEDAMKDKRLELQKVYKLCDGLKNLPLVLMDFHSFHVRWLYATIFALTSENNNHMWFKQRHPSWGSWLEELDSKIGTAVDLIKYINVEDQGVSPRHSVFEFNVQMNQTYFRDTVEGTLICRFQNMLTREEPEVASIFKCDDEEEISRMYHTCLHLVRIPAIFEQVIDFEIELRMKPIFAMIEKTEATGKWFGDGVVAKVDSALTEVVDHILRRCNRDLNCLTCQRIQSQYSGWNRHAIPGLNVHKDAWVTQAVRVEEKISEEIIKKCLVDKMLENENSDVSLALKSRDNEEFKRFYQQALASQHLKLVSASLLELEVERHSEGLWLIVEPAFETWFDGDCMDKIDSGMKQAFRLINRRCDEMNQYSIETGISSAHHIRNMEALRIRRKLSGLVLTELRKLLHDEESHVSLAFKHNNVEEIERIYHVCLRLDKYYPFRYLKCGKNLVTTVLRYEIEKESQLLWSILEKGGLKWLDHDNDSLPQIEKRVSRIFALISKRCGGVNDTAALVFQEFENEFDGRFAFGLCQFADQLKLRFKSFEEKDIDRLYDKCIKLKSIDSIGFELVACDIRVTCRRLWTDICKGMQNLLKSEEKKASLALGMSEKLLTSRSVEYYAIEKFVKEMFALLDRCRTVDRALANPDIEDIILKLFYRVINRSLGDGQPTITDLLVCYIDLLMRQGIQVRAKGYEYSRIERAVRLLLYSKQERCRFLSEQYMAKRLLLCTDVGKPTCSDVANERALTKFMKDHCGVETVVFMEQMVIDCESALEMAEKFTRHTRTRKQRCNHRTPPYRIPAYSGKVWLGAMADGLKVPSPLAGVVSQYEDLYSELEPKRELKFVHSLGNVTFETPLFTGNTGETIEITGSVTQASVLLLFNSKDKMTFEEIVSALQDDKPRDGVDPTRARAHIYAAVRSLVHGACPLLKREPKSGRIGCRDVLSINWNFRVGEKTLLLPDPSQRNQDLDADDTSLQGEEGQVEQGALPVVDKLLLAQCVQAAVAKVMKRKKREEYKKLFEEVAAFGKGNSPPFETSMKVFKEVVEKLIDGDYLERDENDNSILVYVP